MAKARHAGLDRPASEFLPKSSADRFLVGANIGPLEGGSDITNLCPAYEALRATLTAYLDGLAAATGLKLFTKRTRVLLFWAMPVSSLPSLK